MQTAIINKIIPFSAVDGPGNRTVIFFQGCNFNCQYCHNPETIGHCIKCGLCINKCPVQALSFKDNQIIWNKEICINCDQCFKNCHQSSSPKVNKFTVSDVLKIIDRYRPFLSGITVSGGECTLQASF
jgi:YjjW family glycine radical enzyme activase